MTPLTTCVTENECNDDPLFAPQRLITLQATIKYECSECLGYYDHSNEDPVCTPCTLNFCERCKWDFYQKRYECLECNLGAVYDLTINDCAGTCGAIYKYSTLGFIGDQYVEAD